MKSIFKLTFYIVIFFVSKIKSNVYSDARYNIISILRKCNETDREERQFEAVNANKRKGFDLVKDVNDATFARNKVKGYLQRYKNHNLYPILPMTTHSIVHQKHYEMDPVLNILIRRAGQDDNIQGDEKKSKDYSSSSIEAKDWKTEWKEHWIQKKLETINTTNDLGDVVNMVAARPRGAPCGDPNQHDLPWGNCMLTVECEPDFRIYRGDYYCRNTRYVCCAVKLHSYDMYQGFDVSFADTSLSSDVDNRQKNSKEISKRKRRREKRKLKRERRRRKENMKKYIEKIIREITKLLSKTYRNATTVRKRITNQLKKFAEELKEKYKKNREPLKGIHELELLMLDKSVQKKLIEIKDFNEQFITNSTFRQAVIDGSINTMDELDATYRRSLRQDNPKIKPFGQRRFEFSHGLGRAFIDGIDY